MPKKKITDAVEIFDRRYGGTPEWDAMVKEEELEFTCREPDKNKVA